MSGQSIPRHAAFAAVLAVLLAAGEGVCEDWPQFRGPRRDGKSRETGLLKAWPDGGPKLLWTAKGLGKGYSHSAVAGGRVYVTGMLGKTGQLFAFDLAGKQIWSKPYGREWTKSYPGARGTPTVSDGHIYLVSSHGELVCMNAGGGESWRLNVMETFKGGTGQFGFIESLLIDGGRVICTAGGPDATLVALDKKTGRIIWKTAGLKDKAAYCSPMLIARGGRRLIVTMTSHHIIGVDAADGRLLWKQPCRNPYEQSPNTPVYSGGGLFCTTGDKIGSFMLKLSADGREADLDWRQPKLDCHHGNVIAIDGHVYASAHLNSKGWVCLALDSGKVMFESKAVAKGSACYADGMLYCYGTDGSVALVKPSPKGLAVVSKFKITAGSGQHFAHPVLSDGRLYIRRGNAMMVYSVREDAQ